MNDYQIDKQYLISESDVEFKVIGPLLSNPEPTGLGYSKIEIQTKINLQKILIDKGAKSILYYPDYLITVNGVPSIIVEAKKPDEDLSEAFRQAALYAAELNRKFEKDINPCQLIIACDGQSLLAGSWDAAIPQFNIETKNWLYTEREFNALIDIFSRTSVEKKAAQIKNLIRKRVAFKRPLNLLGGKFVQNKPAENTFGESISIQYRHLFNPNIEEEKIDIVHNAYVKITKHESHVNPIDKLIRKKILPSSSESNQIEDNTNPQEIISALNNAHNYNNQVLLLIGSVGSGKSTFSTYLREIALEKEIVGKLVWITIDLNTAPVSSNEIYQWLKNDIIKQIKKQNSDINFNSIDTIQKLYSAEIEALKEGILQLLNPESDKYKEILVEKIVNLQGNIDVTLASYVHQFVHKQKKDLIITLDNCDKRNLEEQLLMFEVANWLKDSVKAIIFLPLRDTTFDHFRKQKPLDTVVNDLIFRISPPSLEKVLYSRIKYASRLIESNNSRYYYLPNNIRVNYPAKEELYYLKAILTSLFQNNFAKRLISGLAGSDIRVGLGIFLDFCKSGHISEHEIFKIKQSKGETKLSNHVVSRVFLRGNKVYYNDNSAKIKNLFSSLPSDDLPDPFVRISILQWLSNNYRIKGPSGIFGFHLAETMMNDLVSLGHDKVRVSEDITYLLRQSLIISESQKSDNIDEKELISINTPGIVHLDLINNYEYLSACAEDVWYNSAEIATDISKNMSGEGSFSHLSLQNTLEHAKILGEYLGNYFDKYFKQYSEFISEDKFIYPLDFTHIRSIINVKSSLLKSKPSKKKIFSVNTILDAKITNIKKFGLIFEIDKSNKTGMVHVSNISDPDFESNYKINDMIKVKVLKYIPDRKKYDFALE